MNQKKTEPAAAITAQQYLDLTQTVMVALDAGGRVVMMNRAGCELLGYAAHEILGCNWFEACLPQPEGVVAAWPVHQRIMAGELAFVERLESRVVRRDGTQRLMHWTNAEIRDEAGRLVGVLSSGEDITGCKRMERLLCVERDLAQALMAVRTLDDALALCLDAAISSSGFDAGAVYLVDPETGAVDLRCHRGLSDAFVDAVRHVAPDSPQARIVHEGRPLYTRYGELAIPMNGARAAETIRAIAVLPIRHRDRVIGCLNIASHAYDEVPEHARASLERLAGQIGQAIVEEQAREAICESEEKYRALFEHTSEALLVAQDGRIVFHNPRAVTLLGCSAEELQSRPFTDFIHEDDRGMVIDRHIRRLRGDELPAHYAFRVIHQSGEILWFELNTVTILWNKKPATLNLMRDITARRRAEAERENALAMLQSALAHSPAGILIADAPHVAIRWANAAAVGIRGETSLPLTGIEVERHASHWQTFQTDGQPYPSEELPLSRAVLKGEITRSEDVIIRHESGEDRWVSVNAAPIRNGEGVITAGIVVFSDITALKRVEAALERRLVALTQPLDNSDEVRFEDLFNPAEIQRLQDEFAQATGVASIITRPDGTPITTPSSFCRLCSDMIRKTEKGLANCFKSDAVLGRLKPDGPIVQPCLSGGLWDAGAAISVGGYHVANWLIGQVRDEEQTEEKMRAYAREIGADENAVVEAFHEVPAMSRERFEKVAHALFTLANQLSNAAYQNIQQARFITARQQAERALRESEQRLRSIAEQLTDLISLTDEVGTITYASPASNALFGLDPEGMVGKHFTAFLTDSSIPTAMAAFRHTVERGRTIVDLELQMKRHDGSVFVAELNAAQHDSSSRRGTLVTIRDITGRKRVEAEREELQAQLTQAQKMESVGRLAGGVAHDFNNMLGVILGYSDLVLSGIEPNSPLRADLLEIRKAAQRSADLTCQLLAFARKQTVAPRVLDLNETVAGMLKMLRRLIGENIDLAWKPGHELWPVIMDPAQIDHILANLCVNARDAISSVGTIMIETDNTAFDEAYCAHHAGFIPGEYVLLAVSDDGCGMDAETLSLIFEPFFTTKEVGKGTGLGLATVYGMVQQNNGFVNVFSEPSRGSTFTIYLPRHALKATRARDEQQQQAVARGSETILLVEDESAILRMTTMMLERLGYAVLAARTPREAIRLANEHSGQIDLLMTDVVMPEMNGRELAKNLLSIFPDIKRLFMSGYPADVIAHQRMLDKGVHFIQKPFLMKELAAKLRETLQRSDKGTFFFF